MRIYFEGGKQGEVDDMIASVFKATGDLTAGRWHANQAPIYLDMRGVAQSEVVHILSATSGFSGKRTVRS